MYFQSHHWHHSSLTFPEVWLFCEAGCVFQHLACGRQDSLGAYRTRVILSLPKVAPHRCLLCKHTFVFINCIVAVPNARLCFTHLWSTVWLSSWPFWMAISSFMPHYSTSKSMHESIWDLAGPRELGGFSLVFFSLFFWWLQPFRQLSNI